MATLQIIISGAVLILAFTLFAYLMFRGLSQAFVGIVCAALLALVSSEGFVTAFFTTFPTGMCSFITNMGLMFISGSVIGNVMGASGCAQSIAHTLTKKLGKKNAPLIIVLTALILMLSGSPTYFLIVAAISIPLLREANLPRYIGMICTLTVSTLAYCLPGIPGLNAVIAGFLGTSLGAAPLLGVIMAIVALTLGSLFIWFLVRKARKANEGYVESDSADGIFKEYHRADELGLPSFWLSLLPILLIIVGTFLLNSVVGIESVPAVVISQTIATVIILLTTKPHFAEKRIQCVGDSIERILPFIMGFSTVTGFATVAATTPAYNFLVEKVMGLNMNPYITTVIVVAVIAALCADGMGALVIFCTTLGPQFIATGANAAVIHRLSLMTATTIESLPHSSLCVQQMSTWNYKHKQVYGKFAVTTILITSVTAVAGLIAALILY